MEHCFALIKSKIDLITNKHSLPRYELGRHYRMDHQGDGIKVWQCSKCGMKSKGNHYLLKHMYNYHYEGIFKCATADCSYQAKFRQSVVNHFRRNHYQGSERSYEGAAVDADADDDAVIERPKQSKGAQQQQCPLEGCLATIRSGELTLRRHLDLVHNSFGQFSAGSSSSGYQKTPNHHQQQLFFRPPDSPAAAATTPSTMSHVSPFTYLPSVASSSSSAPSSSASSSSATFFPAHHHHHHQFITFTEEQQQRELAIAAAAAAAALANNNSSSSSSLAPAVSNKYASERNATAYSIISVNCTAEGGSCTVAAGQPPMRSMDELARHLQTVHGILPFRCYLCTLSFSLVYVSTHHHYLSSNKTQKAQKHSLYFTLTINNFSPLFL